MPEISGREVFTKMKNIKADVKIIVSSGFSKDDDLKELKKHGLSGFIQKPYRKFELSQIVAKILSCCD